MDAWITGIQHAVQLDNFLLLWLGVAIGIVGGALPGLSGSTTVALLIPFTFALEPDSSLIFLAAVFVGAEYGGSIPAVFLNMPGTPSAVVTTLDGYALARKGYPTKALAASLVPGVFGGLFAAMVLATAAAPIASIGVKFGPAEFFMLGILGLGLVVRMGGTHWALTLLATCIGLLMALVGTDPITGAQRLTFDVPLLSVGIGVVPAIVGLLAVSEAFVMANGARTSRRGEDLEISYRYPNRSEWRRMVKPTARGSVIGTIVGVLPGAGGAISSIVAYNEEKRASKHPERFGTGAVEGIAAPESANNANVGGSLLPMLSLGIPASATAAIMMGALTIHGLQPGPSLFDNNEDVVYGLFASQFLANGVMLVIGLLIMKWCAHIVAVPKRVLAPTIIALAVVGTFSIGGSFDDVSIAIALGIVGYALRTRGVPINAIVLAFVLGDFVESNFRRAQLLYGDNYGSLAHEPIFLVLAAAVALVLAEPLIKTAVRLALGRRKP
jgi:putative tricarboxylic transport membrane protein